MQAEIRKFTLDDMITSPDEGTHAVVKIDAFDSDKFFFEQSHYLHPVTADDGRELLFNVSVN